MSKARYRVVINDREQYSIWPVDIAQAPGWRDAGVEGTEQACLEWIEKVWTDMRPPHARDAD